MIAYLAPDDVRGLHAAVMRRTGFLPAPVRDVGALQSAIMRPQMVAHDEGADLLTQAMTLMLAISQAQAFVDDNKRTALFAALVFLELNGCTFDGDDELLAVLLEEAASCPHDEARTTIAEWMRPQIVAQRDEQGAGGQNDSRSDHAEKADHRAGSAARPRPHRASAGRSGCRASSR
jgi:death on curing protein